MTVPYRSRNLLQRELDDARRDNFRLLVIISVLSFGSVVACSYALFERDRAFDALAVCEAGDAK